MHPVDVGIRSEIAVLNELTQLGFHTWTPLSPNSRADLLVDLGRRVLRVQVKTGRLVSGRIIFNTSSTRINASGWHVRGYVGEIDCFAVHCPQLRESYILPIAECATGNCSLRVAPTRNNQRQGIRLASDYRLEDFSPE